jgi:diguanylate cyclase (GGDEF)-like protein
MARWLAIFFAAGATLSLASVIFPHEPQIDVTRVRIAACSAYPTAAFLLFGRRWLVPVVFHVILAIGTVVVSLGVYYGHGGGASATSAVFYCWAALYAFAFFSRRAAFAHIAWIVVCYAYVLHVQGSPTAASQLVLVAGTTYVTGLVVAGLADQIRHLAHVDALTQLPNRRVFDETVVAEMARAARRRGVLSVAIVDLDHFKDVNDLYGHQAGDELLQRVARTWRADLRGWELLARYGGDEFALLFPESGADDASHAVGRLRGLTPEVPFSAGVATWDGEESLDRLMARADAALYKVKRARPAGVKGPLAPLATVTPVTSVA